jgi:hypothetical protein
MNAHFSSSVRKRELHFVLARDLGKSSEVQLAERLCGGDRYVDLEQERQPIVFYEFETLKKSHVRLTPAKLG